MKNLKRIMAIVAVVLLIGMYASTLLFAFIDHSAGKGLLKASIACTILLPVLLYAYQLVYRNIKTSQEMQNFYFEEEEDSTEDTEN